jgi:hypothetical protein
MNLVEVIEKVRNNKTIVVVGPQRSGTTIAGKMLATELKRRYIDEMEFSAHDLWKFMFLLESLKEPAVIQCPALTHLCHTMPQQIAVVFLIRDLNEIAASQDRCKMGSGKSWTQEEEENELAKYFRSHEPIAMTKYSVWSQFQKPTLEHRKCTYCELEYDSLRQHRLWVEKSKRKNWWAKQTANT